MSELSLRLSSIDMKARTALSCCGILTDREIFDPGKNRNRSAVDSKIFPDGNAHLYRLVRELTPGNGSIDDLGRGTTTSGRASGGGQLCLLFVLVV